MSCSVKVPLLLLRSSCVFWMPTLRRDREKSRCLGSGIFQKQICTLQMQWSGAEELGQPTSTEQEMGQAPAGPLQKDPVAVSVSFGSSLRLCWITLLPAIASLHGNGGSGEGRILWGKRSGGLVWPVL